MSILIALCIYLYLVGGLSSLAGAAYIVRQNPQLSEAVGPERWRKVVASAVLTSLAWPVMLPWIFATWNPNDDS